MRPEQHRRVHSYFESRAPTWEQRYCTDAAVRDRIARFSDALQRHAILEGSVLDLGCGSGAIARSLARPGFSMTGTDISQRMLDSAEHQPGADLVRWVHQDPGRPFPLSFEDAQFDVVISSSVLEYLSDPTGALLEMVRLLRPGGWAFFTVPDPRHRRRVRERRNKALLMLPPLRFIANLTPARDYVLSLDLSVNRYPLDTWLSLITAVGLLPSPVQSLGDPLVLMEARKPVGGSGS